MDKIQRYDISREFMNNGEIEEYDDGAYVKYADIKHLLSGKPEKPTDHSEDVNLECQCRSGSIDERSWCPIHDA